MFLISNNDIDNQEGYNSNIMKDKGSIESHDKDIQVFFINIDFMVHLQREYTRI